jgi:hypothetical protein
MIPRMQEFVGLVEIDIRPIHLWHVRFGHLNVDSLIQLQQQGMVKGLPTFQKENARCQACVYGKHKRLPFPISSWRE